MDRRAIRSLLSITFDAVIFKESMLYRVFFIARVLKSVVKLSQRENLVL